MKRIILILAFAAIVLNTNAQQIGTFKDSRDGKTYKTVTIGTQVWMAENLAFKPTSGNYWAYENDQNNVAKYGYLYDWQTALNVCPTGWHLPSDAEWNTLVNRFGGKTKAGLALKSTTGWKENGNGKNTSGFSSLPGGYHAKNGNFSGIGERGTWWCSDETEDENGMVFSRNLFSKADHMYGILDFDDLGYSVRCLKNK
jgi:uncharacterized protein (TIGR02145 family)